MLKTIVLAWRLSPCHIFSSSGKDQPPTLDYAQVFITKFFLIAKLRSYHRYKFSEAITALKSVRAGQSMDGKGVIKVIINGPDVED